MNAIARWVALGCAIVAIDAAALAWRRPWEPARRGSLKDPADVVERFVHATAALRAGSAGARLADQLPATADLASELLAGRAFAERRLGVEERDQLVRVEPTSARWLASGGAEVHTREFWIFRTSPNDRAGEAAPAVSAVWNVRYELIRDGGAWRVADFRLESPPGAPGGEGR